MVLTVPFEGFAKAVRDTFGGSVAYLSSIGRYTVATAGDCAKGVLIRSDVLMSMEEAANLLKAAGLNVANGVWRDRGVEEHALWVAAIAYHSSQSMPGLWIETYDSEPTKGQVLTDMYDEFCENGEVDDLPLDDFVRAANANIVILSPENQAAMAQRLRGGG